MTAASSKNVFGNIALLVKILEIVWPGQFFILGPPAVIRCHLRDNKSISYEAPLVLLSVIFAE